MNKKMTFPELVDAVASATETSKKVSETFLKELFSLIADTLRSGENVKVKNLGIFKLIDVEARKSVNVNTGEEIEIPSHRKVSFMPDKSIADAINMPFASFETVVLSDNLSENELKKISSVEDADEREGLATIGETDNPMSEVCPPPFDFGINDKEDGAAEDVESTTCKHQEVEVVVTENVPTQAQTEEKEKCEVVLEDVGEACSIDAQQRSVTDNIEDHETVKQTHFIPEEDDEEFVEPQSEKKNNSFMRGFLWGAVTMFIIYLIAICGLYFYKADSLKEGNDAVEIADSLSSQSNQLEKYTASKIDSTAKSRQVETPEHIHPKGGMEGQAKSEIAQAEKAIVRYDTITRTKFLTRLAKKYYGNSDFWVYIYEENKSIIKNPNTISPGTVVVIPSGEKYGIDKNDAESLRAARKKAAEIENKYR